MSEYKSSIVSIIGKPNVGKSTLLNRIVGQKISIVTPKSQTTRNIISGITTIDNAQIVFLDTPGIFEAKRSVDKSIVKQAWSSINSADLVLLLLDAAEKLDEHFPRTLEKLKKSNVRIIVGINKIDVKKNRLVEILQYLVDNDIKDVFQISASLGTGIDFLLKHIINNSKPSNWCYSEDEVTTLPMKFLSSEITREQVFLNLHEELPYNMIVETEDLKTLDDGLRYSLIPVTKNTPKGGVNRDVQYHEVKINLDIRPIDECLWAVTTLSCNSGTQPAGTPVTGANQYAPGRPVPAAIAYNQSLVAASLYVDYVFLDTDERRRFAQNPHEYLITQLQFTGDESVGSSSNKIKLNFNHPVKELIWVVQPDQNVDYCSSLVCDALLFKVLGAQPFNYTDAIDALPNAIHAFGGPAAVAQDSRAFIDARGLFQDAGALDYEIPAGFTGYWHGPNNPYNEANMGGVQIPTSEAMSGLDPSILAQLSDLNGSHMDNSTVSDAGTFVLTETSLDLHCWGQNPVVTAKLQLNGQDRFSEREGSYFSWVQPYQAHTRCPDEGINVYSFALRPEEHQPSGTCNFSRIDNATLQLVLSNATVEGTKTAKVRVYATNYNVLRIMSGMGGLAYSN